MPADGLHLRLNSNPVLTRGLTKAPERTILDQLLAARWPSISNFLTDGHLAEKLPGQANVD